MGQIISFNPRNPRDHSRDQVCARPVRSNRVADLLLALEDRPPFTLEGAVARGLFRRPSVIIATGERSFDLTPDEARLAAAVMIAEQAYVGCVEDAHVLMTLACTADAMRGAA